MTLETVTRVNKTYSDLYSKLIKTFEGLPNFEGIVCEDIDEALELNILKKIKIIAPQSIH